MRASSFCQVNDKNQIIKQFSHILGRKYAGLSIIFLNNDNKSFYI